MKCRLHARSMSISLLLLAAASCTSPVTPGDATTVVAVSSDRQTLVVGTSVVLEVLVTDANGTPVPDAPLAFGVPSNRRIPVPIGDWVRTGPDGKGRLEIQVPLFVNGERVITVGESIVAASLVAHGASSTCYFYITVLAGPVAKISMSPATGVERQAGSELVASAWPMDAFGNNLAGVPVTFSVGGGGAVSPSAVASNALGGAETRWTLGAASGTYTLTATAGSVSGSVTANVVAPTP
jgi:hypothetical protein